MCIAATLGAGCTEGPSAENACPKIGPFWGHFGPVLGSPKMVPGARKPSMPAPYRLIPSTMCAHKRVALRIVGPMWSSCRVVCTEMATAKTGPTPFWGHFGAARCPGRRRFDQVARGITTVAVNSRPETFGATHPPLPTARCIKNHIGRPHGCGSTRFRPRGSEPLPPKPPQGGS